MTALRVRRLAAGGDGVGTLADGRAVFVPRTAPGDLVTLRNVRLARRFARARLDQLVEPSPDRAEPRCPHYVVDECGGCQLQHLSYDAQLAGRRGFVGDALRRLGRLDVADPPIEPSPSQFGYRAKLTLHAAADGRRIGLRRYGRPDDLFDLAWCHITDSALMELWQAVRARRDLLPPRLDRVVLRLDRAGERHLVVAVRGSDGWPRAGELAGELARAGQPAMIWWHPEGGAARVVAGRRFESPHVTVFEQVHPAMGDRARAYAVAALGDVRGRAVWDLYAGIGETTAALAAAGGRVESVEIDRRAVAHAEASGPPARRHAAAAEATVDALELPELVITNPPRTGMDPRVTAAIARHAPRRVVYVSCDPATLARDVARLGPGFELRSVHAFDLFPQTAHVEAVAVLSRT
ncbi:MAG TPA: hypothetical protein VFW66_04950 [Gemmatimonadales bacterium]|nr:hypothetical protein [Gemmatimonadales bacterium]